MDLTETFDRFLNSAASRFEVGEQVGRPDLGATAVMFVAVPTEALKQVSSGVVRESVNREAAWEVIGVSVSRSVAEALPNPAVSIEELIEAVQAGGFRWEVIEKTVDPSAPNM